MKFPDLMDRELDEKLWNFNFVLFYSKTRRINTIFVLSIWFYFQDVTTIGTKSDAILEYLIKFPDVLDHSLDEKTLCEHLKGVKWVRVQTARPALYPHGLKWYPDDSKGPCFHCPTGEGTFLLRRARPVFCGLNIYIPKLKENIPFLYQNWKNYNAKIGSKIFS